MLLHRCNYDAHACNENMFKHKNFEFIPKQSIRKSKNLIK